MSEVYGFCKAGCRYRVPTYDEFARSASIVKQSATDGAFLLEVGKKYKIAKTVKNATYWGFTVSVEFFTTKDSTQIYYGHSITFPACTKYDKYLTFRLIEVVLDENQDEYGSYPIRIVAEVNGQIQEYETGNTEYNPNMTYEVVSATVNGATECYLINEDAMITAADGDSAFIRYSANADGTDFTEKPVSGQCYIGFATGKTAPIDKSGYQWVYLGVPEYDGTVVIEE